MQQQLCDPHLLLCKARGRVLVLALLLLLLLLPRALQERNLQDRVQGQYDPAQLQQLQQLRRKLV